MTLLEKTLLEILTIYDDLRDQYKNEIEHSPEGSLLYQKDGNYIEFLHSFYENGIRIRKGINKKPELIKDLARKEFCTRACEILTNNIDEIKEAINKQIPFDIGEILKSMTKAYALVPEEYFFNSDKMIISSEIEDDLASKIRKHEEWWKKPYKEYWGFPQYKIKVTSRGQKVRSISELLIAEKLYEYSIPFHYEEEFQFAGKTYAPDFTFEGADYNCFYLDYFGMMDNEKYARRNINKLNDYYDAGLIPGNNLIIAFDSQGIMNVNAIKSLIENEIIPRL